LCDEATSALDSRAEKAVQNALDQVSLGKTTLIIAHKLATVMAADNIVVMVKGQVVEQGTHLELVQRDSLYAAMVRAQDLGETTKTDATDGNFELGAQEIGKSPEKSGADAATGLAAQLSSGHPDEESAIEPLTAETIGASVLKCAYVMLSENKDLYPWYLLLILAYILVGGTYAIQAVLTSHLIQTFSGATAGHDANFYALMLFTLALVTGVGYFCVGWASNSIGRVLIYRYRKEMMERILDMDQVSHERVSSNIFSNRPIGLL
jgi:ATP-binding cassette, subfamily B (MDR/TAP), member 1